LENLEILKSRLKKTSKLEVGVGNNEKSLLHPRFQVPSQKSVVDSDNELEDLEVTAKEKRSSTGSITSLKKMWEDQKPTTKVETTCTSKSVGTPKTLIKAEKVEVQETSQSTAHLDNANGIFKQERRYGKTSSSRIKDVGKEISPLPRALSQDNGKVGLSPLGIEKSQDETNGTSQSLSVDRQSNLEQKTESSTVNKLLTAKVRRVWPPLSSTTDITDKPLVPVKPCVRKNPIYATPSQRLESSSKDKRTGESGKSEVPLTDRSDTVKRWLALDAMISTLTCSTGNLIPILEEASILHAWGQKYAETLTPVARFQLIQVLVKLEAHIQDKNLHELQCILRDFANVIQR
jgi:hypothetical protein